MRKIACKFFSLKALAKVRSNLKGKDRNNGKNSKLLLLITRHSGKRKESILKSSFKVF